MELLAVNGTCKSDDLFIGNSHLPRLRLDLPKDPNQMEESKYRWKKSPQVYDYLIQNTPSSYVHAHASLLGTALLENKDICIGHVR